MPHVQDRVRLHTLCAAADGRAFHCAIVNSVLSDGPEGPFFYDVRIVLPESHEGLGSSMVGVSAQGRRSQEGYREAYHGSINHVLHFATGYEYCSCNRGKAP